MGRTQTTYSARLVIKINDAQVFDKIFEDLEQTFFSANRYPGYVEPTVFPLEGISEKVKAGDKIEIQVTPDIKVSIFVIFPQQVAAKGGNSGDWSFGEVSGYGKAAIKFRLW